jgi:hypothetical protein
VRQRQHGTNACYRWGPNYGSPDYRNGCRCAECRHAGYVYEVKRQRDRNRGIVRLHDNTEAREHILWLRSQGVGLRAVAAATGLQRHNVWKIANGQVKRSKPETIRRIMAVGTHMRKGGSLVDAGPTWRLIDDMLANGFTRTRIAAELGSKAKRPALQLKRDKILQSNADQVREVYDRLMAPVIARREQVAAARAYYRKLEREAS